VDPKGTPHYAGHSRQGRLSRAQRERTGRMQRVFLADDEINQLIPAEMLPHTTPQVQQSAAGTPGLRPSL
jgi:hypothetical protein